MAVPRDLWKFSPFCRDGYSGPFFFFHSCPALYLDPLLLLVRNNKSPQFWLMKDFCKAWSVFLKWLSGHSELNKLDT